MKTTLNYVDYVFVGHCIRHLSKTKHVLVFEN